MADIKVTCTGCNGTLTVSEYADIDALKCRICGAAMEKPGGSGEGVVVKKPGIRLTTPEADREPEELTDADRENIERQRKVRSFFPKQLIRPSKASRRSSKSAPVSMIRYWALFFLILITSAALRWGNVIGRQSAAFDIMIEVALFLFGLLHIVMVAEAFRDDIFQGVLCLFIPFYSVYYLLRLTDALWLRAVGIGLLLTFGLDLMEFLTDFSIGAYHFINEWISSGAT